MYHTIYQTFITFLNTLPLVNQNVLLIGKQIIKLISFVFCYPYSFLYSIMNRYYICPGYAWYFKPNYLKILINLPRDV